MRVIYIPERDDVWEQYYNNQATQSGHGIAGFEGTAYQRGNGLGNFLGRIFRSVLPVIKSVGKRAAKTVGREALTAGANIVGDYTRGRNFGEAANEHGRNALLNIVDETAASLKQKGKGMSRQSKKSTIKVPIQEETVIVKKPRVTRQSKNIAADIFNINK